MLWKRILFLFMAFGFITNGYELECFSGEMPSGFYWPTENNNLLLGWYGTNPKFPGGIHIGQDIRATEDDDVYAIADGTVLQNRLDVACYGGFDDNGNCIDGGALLIEHMTLDGKKFIALYGHIKDISVGSTVNKNQKIAKIGPYRLGTTHLHFGIRYPSTTSGNPWAGYGYGNDNGFVDPIAFIKNNTPRNWLSDACLPFFRVGNIAWYPDNVSCAMAKQWRYHVDNQCPEWITVGKNICSEKEFEMIQNLNGTDWQQIIYGWGDINQYKKCE